MNEIILVLLILFLFAGFLVYLEREAKRRDKVEKERFREFVLAIKSKNVVQYVETLPASEEELPTEEEDELIDLDEVDPETLLKAMKNK